MGWIIDPLRGIKKRPISRPVLQRGANENVARCLVKVMWTYQSCFLAARPQICEFIKLPLRLVAILYLLPFPLAAQFDTVLIERKPAQAQSRQELDAYLDMVESHEPEKTVSLAAGFAKQFPDSEFLGYVHSLEMDAYLALNDYQNSVAAGEKALERNPKDANALLKLAKVLPNGAKETDSSTILDKAENYARKAIEEISALKAPRTLSLAEFRRVTAQMKATAHEALGIIAFKRGRYPESVAEFERSTGENPMADGALFYRLGMAYLFSGNLNQAKTALKRALELGPEVVRTKAEEQLARLRNLSSKNP
jgi:tetratricopeptide (TPR) repeat protein